MRSTNCHSCIPLDGLRQSGQLVSPPILQRLRACRFLQMPFRLCCSGYNTIAFIFDGSDARSAARERKTIVRQNVTFPQIPAT